MAKFKNITSRLCLGILVLMVYLTVKSSLWADAVTSGSSVTGTSNSLVGVTSANAQVAPSQVVSSTGIPAQIIVDMNNLANLDMSALVSAIANYFVAYPVLTQQNVVDFLALLAEATTNPTRLASMVQADITSIQDSIQMAIYGGVFAALYTSDADQKKWTDSILPSLQSSLANLVISAQETVLNTPNDKRNYWNNVLVIYRDSAIDRIKALVSSNRLPSPAQFLGTRVDASDGLLQQLIAQRMEDTEDQLVLDGDLENVKKCWTSTASLLTLASYVLQLGKLGLNVTTVRSQIAALQKRLYAPITFVERLTALQHLQQNGFGYLASSNAADACAKMLNRFKRLVKSMDANVTSDQKQAAISLVHLYMESAYSDVNTGNAVKAQVADLQNLISFLSRSVLPGQLFTNSVNNIALTWVDNNGKKWVVAYDAQGNIALMSDTAVAANTHWRVVINQEKILLEASNNTNKTSATAVQYAYLSGNPVKVAAAASLGQFDANDVNQATFFKDDVTNYEFFVSGSQAKFSLQSCSAKGGVLTVGINQTLATQSISTQQPLGTFDTNGNLVQTAQNTFVVVPVTSIISSLSSLREELVGLQAITDPKLMASGLANLAGDYQDLAAVALNATAEEQNLFVLELISVVNLVSTQQNIYQQLTSAMASSTTSAGDWQALIQAVITGFATNAKQSKVLAENLDVLNSSWQNLMTVGFVQPAAANAPLNGDVVALKVGDKYLQVQQVVQVDGTKIWYLTTGAFSPAEAAAQFQVTAFGNIFGFQSALVGAGSFLATKDLTASLSGNIVKKDQDGWLSFQSQIKDAQGKQTLFQDQRNALMQYNLSSSSDGLFTVQNIGTQAYVALGSDGYVGCFQNVASSAPSKNAQGDALKIQFVPVNNFYKQLTTVITQSGDATAQFKAFANLLNFVSVADELNAWSVELINFFAKQKADAATWQRFSSLADNVTTYSAIVTQFASLKKITRYATANASMDNVVSAWGSGYVLDVSQWDDTDIAIGWVDLKNQTWYLVSDSAGLGFTCTSLADPDCRVLMTSAPNAVDNTVFLQDSLGNDLCYVLDSSTNTVKFAYEVNNKPPLGFNQKKFRLVGGVQNLSIILDELPNRPYLTVGAGGKLTVLPGKNVGSDQQTPSPQQTFCLLQFTLVEKTLQAARMACDFTKSNLTLQDMASALNNYGQVIATLLKSTDGVSEADQQLLFDEVAYFVNQLTTQQSGKYYTTLLADAASSDFFEQTILAGLNKLAINSVGQQTQLKNIVNSWQEGYVGSNVLKAGTIIALALNDTSSSTQTYLQTVQTTYEGAPYYQIRALPDLLNAGNVYVVTTYKDRVGLLSQQFTGKAVQVVDSSKVANAATSPLGRVRLSTAPMTDTLGKSLNFGDVGTELQQFVFTSDKSGNYTITNAFYAASAAKVADAQLGIDSSDNNFLRVGATNRKASFKVVVLSPLHLKLIAARNAISSADQIKAYLDIVTGNFIQKDLKALFITELTNAFQALKFNSTAWATFSNNAAAMKNLDSLMAGLNANTDLFTVDDLTYLNNLYQGQAVTLLAQLDKRLVAINWTDSQSTIHYLQFVDAKTPSVMSGKDNLDKNCIYTLQMSGSNGDQMTLVSGSGDNVNNLILVDSITCTVIGQQAQVSIQNSAQKFLTVDPVALTLSWSDGQPGVQGNFVPSPFTQVFAIENISVLQNSLAQIRLLDAKSRVSAYANILSKPTQNMPGANDLSIVLGELNNLVTTITSSQTTYQDLIADNSFASNLQAVFTAASKMISTLTKDLATQKTQNSLLTSIQASWRAGYVGSLPDGSPQDGQLVAFKVGSTYLVVDAIVYQNNNWKGLHNTATDFLANNSVFKVSVVKDKVTLSPLSAPNSFVQMPYLPAQQGQLIVDVAPKVAQNYQFSLVSQADGSFYLQNTDLNGNQTFWMVQDGGFVQAALAPGKTMNYSSAQLAAQAANPAIKMPAINGASSAVNVIVLTPCQQKLLDIANAVYDSDKLKAHLQLLTQNYITTQKDADFWLLAMTNYLNTKRTSRVAWNDFVSDAVLNPLMSQIFTAAGAISLLTSGLPALMNLYNANFVQSLEQPTLVQLSWQTTSGATLYWKVMSDLSVTVTTASALDPATIFTIQPVVNADSGHQVNLLYTSTDGKTMYALVLNDTVGATGTSFNRKPMSLKTVSAGQAFTDANGCFTYQGSMDQMAFQTSVTGGFISVGNADHALSSLTTDKVPVLAGINSGGVLIPSMFELFTLTAIAPTTQYLANLIAVGSSSVTSALKGFLAYPTYYSQQQKTLLKLNPADVTIFIKALQSFVQLVTENQDLDASVTQADNDLFAQIIKNCLSLNLDTLTTTNVKQLATLWQRGFTGVPNPATPADGSAFMLFVGSLNIGIDAASAQTAVGTASTSTAVDNSGGSDWNDNSKVTEAKVADAPLPAVVINFVEPRIVRAVKRPDDSSKYCLQAVLPVANWDQAGDWTKDLDTFAQVYEADVLVNDPWLPSSSFISKATGELLGISSALSGGVVGTAAVKLSDTKDKALWGQAIATFTSDQFMQTFVKNPQQFTVQTLNDGVVLRNELTGYALSVNLDGYLRGYRQTSATGVLALDNTVALQDSSEKFSLVKVTDFHTLMFKARATVDNKAKFALYQQAQAKIMTSWDLKLWVDEIIRFVAGYKTTASNWQNFMGLTSLISALQSLYSTTRQQFATVNANGVGLTPFQTQLLLWEEQFLSGVNTPNFNTQTSFDEVLPTFAQAFNNLKNTLNGMLAKQEPAFVQAVLALCARRTELDLTNQSTVASANLSYAQTTVADWIDYQVIANNLIASDAAGVAKLQQASAQLRSEYTFAEMVNYFSNMAQSYPNFSNQRCVLYFQQVAKLVSNDALTRAWNELFVFDNAKAAFRQAMANQLRNYLARPFDAKVVTPPIDWNPTNKTYNDYMLYIINKLLVYPTVTGDVWLKTFQGLCQPFMNGMLSKMTAADKATLASQLTLLINMRAGCVGNDTTILGQVSGLIQMVQPVALADPAMSAVASLLKSTALAINNPSAANLAALPTVPLGPLNSSLGEPTSIAKMAVATALTTGAISSTTASVTAAGGSVIRRPTSVKPVTSTTTSTPKPVSPSNAPKIV